MRKKQQVFLVGVLVALFMTGCVLRRVPPRARKPAATLPASSPTSASASQGVDLTVGPDGDAVAVQVDGDSVFSHKMPVVRMRVLTRGFDNFQEAKDLLESAGDFEGKVEKSWDDFSFEGKKLPCHGTATQERSHSGEASLKVPPATSSFCASAPISVVPGQRYRVGAWWFTPSGYLHWHFGASPVFQQMVAYRKPGVGNGVYIQWLGQDRRPLEGGSLRLLLPFSAATPEWRFQQAEAIAPPGAAFMRVIIQSRTTTEDTALFVDGLKVVESPEKTVPLVVENSSSDDGTFSQQLRGEGVVVDVTYLHKGGAVFVNGKVRSLPGSPTEKAIDLVLAFPIDAQGGKFFPNLHEAQAIEREGRYENAISALSFEWLPVSLYPYIGVATAAGRGVALALPPTPQWARLYYDASRQALVAVFHLGLSHQATHVEGGATFSLVLTAFDPSWGLRGLVDRYVSLFPAFFDSPLVFYAYGFPKEEIYPCRSADGKVKGMERLAAANAEHRLATAYVGTALGLEVARKDQKQPTSPTYEQIMQQVTALASPVGPVRQGLPLCREGYQNRTDGFDEIARIVLESSALDARHHPSLYGVSAPQWWSVGWWVAQWVPNWDPDLPQGYGQWIFQRKIKPLVEATAQAGVLLDAFRWDNFVTSTAIDHRPEAVGEADYPLSFDPSYFEVGEPTPFTFYEFSRFVFADYLNNPASAILPSPYKAHYVGAGANAWCVGCINYIKLDYYGGEGQTRWRGEDLGMGDNWNFEVLDYRRAVAYHRPMSFSNYTGTMDRDRAYAFLQPALLYGVFPTPNLHVAPKWEKGAMCLFAQTADKVLQYAGAGWEPIPFARPKEGGFRIERFGRSFSRGLYFAVYNETSEDADLAMQVDLSSLGIPPEASLHEVTSADIPANAPLFRDLLGQYCKGMQEPKGKYFPIRNGEVTIPSFPAGTTRVFRVEGQQEGGR